MEVTKASAWIEALGVSKAAFLSGKYGTLYTWGDVPVYWFPWAIEANLLEWAKGEKQKRVDAAMMEARNEGLSGEQAKARAQVIQRKRAIWDKLIQPASAGRQPEF
jgi:hypothetical protein